MNISGLISFGTDWFDLLAVQGTLKSPWAPQFKSINSSSKTFFMVQLSHLYITTGKTIALTIGTFVGKMMSLHFNMMSAAAAGKSLQSCLTLQTHGLQQTRLTCPPPSQADCSNACPLSWSVMLSNHFILCHPFSFPSVFPSIRVFSNGSALLIRWPKCWSFSISASNECSVLISFRIN